MTITTPTLITFALYLLVTFAIGIVAYRSTNNLSDYILGGRRLGPKVAALSVGASDMSAWLLLGLPGAIYVGGLSEMWIAPGLLLGAWLNWRYIAKPLRIYTELANNSITLPDFFENRFEDQQHLLRVFSAVIILLFFTFYTASGLVGGAILFSKTFGLDYHLALWVGATVIVSYTFIGGFLAVSWTDFFQSILMLLALIIVPLAVWNDIGSIENIASSISAIDPKLLRWSEGLTIISLLSLLAWGLGYVGQPHILARFMAIKTAQDIAQARTVAMSWMILALIGAIITGFVGIAFFAKQPIDNPETVFLLLANQLFNPWVAGFLIAAIMSAIMSTVDSQLLVCSSALTEDFYRVFLRKKASSIELVWVGRLAVLLIALIAALIASNPENKVLELVSYAWAGFGASFGPVVILTLYWPGMTAKGALAGMLTGAVTVVFWKQMSGAWFDVYEILPGFAAALLAIVLVSKADRKPAPSILAGFAQARDKYQEGRCNN